MKKTALLLAALVTGALMSADDAPATSYSVTADFPYASSYVFRGVKIATGSFQPSLKLTSGAAYGGIWINQPLDRDYDNEIDFYAGYNFEVAKGWTLDVGATLYYYPQLDTSSGADEATFEPYVGLNGTIGGGVTLGLYLYRDFTLDATTGQGSLGYSIPVNDKVTCNVSANLGYVSVDNGGGHYTYYGASVQFPYKLSDKATVTLGGSYASNDIDGAEDDLFWANVGFTYTF